MFCYIWEYEVRPECSDAFKHLYGPDGRWVALFSTSDSYRGTELLRSSDNPSRFLTIDHWLSQDACDAFHRTHALAFKDIDAEGDLLTLAENYLGGFHYVESRPQK